MEPIVNARIDSSSVVHRCFQITPLANQATIWLPTSTGVEKKNGGSSMRPNTGTVASNCQRPRKTTATSNCKERSVILDTVKLLPSSHHRIVASLASRLRERSDQAGSAFGMAVQRLDQLVARQARRESCWFEIGRDQRERIVMRRAGRRAGTEIMRKVDGAFAA